MSKDNIIKGYKLKNGEVRYMFRLYMGVDSLTEKQCHDEALKQKQRLKIRLQS